MATQRTTVRLDDDLLRAAKQRALDEGTTVTELIARGLRHEIQTPVRKPLDIPIPRMDGDGGWVLPVDPTDTSAILDYLDELDGMDEHFAQLYRR